MSLTSLYFSPTGTTRRVVKAFAEGFGGACVENDITLPGARSRKLQGFANADLALFAGPVYGGRSFKLLTNTIRKLQGGGRPAAVLATYGGRHYDMALADLYQAATDAGFQVAACGAFIGEHSFSRNIQTGRPDAEDLALARVFGQKVREKLEAGTLKAMPPEAIPQRPIDLAAIGMHRERLGRLTPNRPAPDETCLHCGACAVVCPLGLIDIDDSDIIRPGCLKCNTCVKTCPVGAMQFRQEDFREVARNCEETFGREERSPQVWFG
jgi:ferredoxin